MVRHHELDELIKVSKARDVSLVIVSKTRTTEEIMEVYEKGVRDFGENKVQELMDKVSLLPSDIRWHFIGHLQRNKVRFLADFVHLIHSVDSLRLAAAIDREGEKCGRKIDILLQVHIAKEETKYGFDRDELLELLEHGAIRNFRHLRLRGLMGMATFTEDNEVVREEFRDLKSLFDEVKDRFYPGADFFNQLSMGMSGDYDIAISEGSTIIRVGSLVFGPRS